MTHGLPLSLVIIDDHPLFRRGVVQLIYEDPEFTIIGEASGGQEGISLVCQLEPDMVLLDLNMKDMSGIDVLKEIKAWKLDSLIIMLTVSDQADDLMTALRSGADGYLLKETEPETLLLKLKEAAQGQVTLSDRMASLLAHSLRADSGPKTPDEAGLTEQEQRVLEHISTGMSNKLIARELDITEGTVKVHVKNLLRKLNLRSRLEAAIWMLEQRRR
ncbi:MAG: two-component system response regulator NarL [Thiohalomonadaceae bacterium]